MQTSFTQLQSFPLPQLLPSVTQLASPISDTIKVVPKFLNDLTRNDKNLEFNTKVNNKSGKSGGNNDKNQTLTTNGKVSSTFPLFTTSPPNITTTSENYNHVRTEEEKIATPLQIINQHTMTSNGTTNESSIIIEKNTTPISVTSNYF